MTMEWFTLFFVGITLGCLAGLALVIRKIVQDEKEKKEKLAFQKAFSKRHNKRMGCPDCGCLPCQCGS